MASEVEFEPTLRLHRFSWMFHIVDLLRQMIFPLIVLLFFGLRRNDPDSMGLEITAALGVILLINAIWRQWTYRYGFGPRGLVIREGLVFRNVRQIEYARIENVDTESGLLHRLVGVVEVRIQTSTGGKPEAQIKVLSEEAVEEMRARIFSQAQPPAAQEAAPLETSLLRLSPMELVKYGLTDNRGMLVVAAGLGVLHEFGFFRKNSPALERLYDLLPVEDVFALSLMSQVALAVAAALVAIVVLRVLSVVLALVTFYDFNLTRAGGDLHIQHGLFTRVALTLRARRIQAVHRTQTLLHRLFERVALNVDLAGDAGQQNRQGGEGKLQTRWLAPVCAPAAAPGLIAAALPEVDVSTEPAWQTLAPRARGRIFRKSLVLSILILIGPALWYLREHAVWVVAALIPLAWMYALFYVKYTRWALTPDAVWFRYGWLTRRLTLAPRNRVQAVHIGISPFDRRSRMASVSVDTAGGRAAKASIRIRYLTLDDAENLAAALYRTATG